MQELTIRTEPTPNDPENVREIVSSSGFFHDYEIPVAVELVQERIDKGESSGYHFVFADINGQTISYACFGPIPCTKNSYDLYWIATKNEFRGKGVGKVVLNEAERLIKKLGGKTIYIETSSKPLYIPTRKFYISNGYKVEAQLKDFYDINDDKIIFSKLLE
ncbi:MAG TPA: N-acetyltransferase [Bacteroidales bacterium]|nr:N-acetyltransferase [Bacteroidales bacterium]